MQNIMRYPLMALIGWALYGAAAAQTTPVGTWQTFDETTGEAKSEVTLSQVNGVISGRVTKFLRPGADPNRRCEACTDDRKNQLMLGMEIIRGVRATEAPNQWGNGEILDPENGKTYRVQLTLSADNESLAVKGSLFIFSRTQTWKRLVP